MMYYIIFALLCVSAWLYFKRRKAKLANMLYPYECVYVGDAYSIYSCGQARGRSYLVLQLSAPVLVSSAVFSSSSYDAAYKMLQVFEGRVASSSATASVSKAVQNGVR